MTLRHNNSKTDGQRHGSTESSGADSWRSTDTVKGPFGSIANARATPMKVNTNKKHLYVLPGLFHIVLDGPVRMSRRLQKAVYIP